MENVTGGNLTDYTQFTEYKVSVVMWKVVPPFILVLGTFGNLATILVMSRIKDNNSSQYVILMALAMADLCVLYSGLLNDWLWILFDVYVADLHTILCKLHHWAVYASNTTSAWLVTTVTVQRTMAVLWPHRMRVMCTVRRTWVVIAVVVVTACSVHLHIPIGFHLIDKMCYSSGKYKQFYLFIWRWVDACISSLLPSACLLVGSGILSWTLFKASSFPSSAVHATSNNTGHPDGGRKSSAVKVTVMVLTLSCTFLLLTLPVGVQNFWVDSGNTYTPETEAMSYVWEFLVFAMWYSNSAVNFLLYCITGARFRKEFVSLLCCGIKGHTGGETTAVASSGGGSKRQSNTPLSA